MQGLIIKGIGGFYYIEKDKEIFCCKARGKFRKEKISPLVGDTVIFTAGEGESEGSIDEILPRKNSLVRPAVANIDKLFIICSTVQPNPNTLIIDKTIAIAELKNIQPIIVITKNDIKNDDEIERIYKKVGLKVYKVSQENNMGQEEIKKELKNSISAFTGNSGVGKSTLLNSVLPKLNLETGDISRKLGRGRHTTRHVELYQIEDNAYVADTPGFSTMELVKYEIKDKDDVKFGFREFEKYLGECKFNSCTHTCEKGCAVIEAVNLGKIETSRHESFTSMYNEIKDVKQW